MKVLTLLQPWATLVVIGAKKVETRGFNTKFNGEILIHASSDRSPVESLLRRPVFAEALSEVKELPFGAIIGCVSIAGTFKTEEADTFFFESDRFFGDAKTEYEAEKNWEINVKREKAFGDYSPGRYGWELFEPVAYTNYTNLKGGVGFTKEFNERICLKCGCTDNNCLACMLKTGIPCSWVDKNLCSACA